MIHSGLKSPLDDIVSDNLGDDVVIIINHFRQNDGPVVKQKYSEKIKKLVEGDERIHVVKPGMYTSKGLQNIDFDKINRLTFVVDYTHILIKSMKISSYDDIRLKYHPRDSLCPLNKE